MSGNNTKFDDGNNGDLRDPALRRALDHAPDSDARPDPRTRDAILKMAHNLAEAPVTASPAANSASAAPWWRRLFGGGGEPRARMPWNAAFATVLVAGFVAVLWHREPVPDARLDGEARVGGATAQAPVPVAPPATAPAQAATEAAPPAEAPAAVAQAPAAPAAEQRAKAPAPRDSSSSKKAADAASADALQRAAPKPSLKQAAPAPVAPAEPVTPSTPPAVVAEQSAPAPVLRDERREAPVENERRSAYAAGAPAAPPPPAAAPANQDSASAELSGGLRSTAPGAAAKAMTRPRSAAASFSALERWTSFNFTRSGASVRHERGDIEGLPALVSTVARSATAPDEPLAAPVEARLELYRGNALVAVLEIAGGQVRWTSQPGGAALIGTPPAQALDALRSLLMR
ncbi:hypothetical protein [Variovorax paradoxus]|jgi:hypothetical protein|uniref:hypothetical protein n=1 Tax=Variovorax paradoxus TaxID=34073 RepID=UPI0033937E57